MNTAGLYIQDELTAENIAYYQKYGFLIGKNLISQEEIEALKQETEAIFKGERGEVEGLAQIAPDASSEEILKQYIAIHFPHKISSHIQQLLSHKAITQTLEGVVSPNVKCMQSMLFVKAPGKPGQSWHQDEYFIPTRDKSLIGAWIAIDDADLDNGCLWVIPGSHHDGFLRKRIPYNGDEYGDIDVCDLTPFTNEDAIPVEVPSGSIVFFHGYLLHRSLANHSEDRYRRALVNHYMSAESQLPWNQDGKLSDVEDLRDIVMVAGEDPYAWKGLQEVSTPFLRAEKVDYKKQGLK